MNVNFLDECCYLANSWGSGHVLFFFDSYIGEEMSHTWLRGWYHLLMQIMCLDEEWGCGWGREWSRMPLGREHSFLWLSVDCRWQLPTSASTSCWVCDQLCWEVVCVCVCVCTKADLFHHKISSYYIYMVLIASVEETIWMSNQTDRHKLW